MKESTDFFNETAAKDNADALEKIRASGKVQVHDLTDEEKKAWVAKLMPVHVEMQNRFGKEFIEKIYAASGFTPPHTEDRHGPGPSSAAAVRRDGAVAPSQRECKDQVRAPTRIPREGEQLAR